MVETLRGVHDDLRGRTVRGTAWSGVSVGARIAATVISMPLIARLLTPEQYGIVALTTLVTEIVGLFGQFGLDSALVQRRRVRRVDLETAFWTDVAVGSALMIVIIALAPPAAWFFHQPVLTPLLTVAASGFVVNGCSSIYNTILTRAMRFRLISVIEIASVTVRTGLAVWLAWAGLAYWALVVAGIAGFLISALLRIAVVRWRPRPRFAGSSFHSLFRFGRNILGDNMLSYLSNNIDYLIIGRRLGAQSLGYYEMAFALPDMVRKNMAATLTRVLYPVYSRVQSHEATLKAGFFGVVEGISLVAFPLLAGLAVLAPQFVPLYFGPQWQAAITPVQLLAVAGMVRSVTIHMGTIIHARGRPDITMKMTAIRVPLLGIAVWTGTYWGLDGTAAAFTAFSYVWSAASIAVLAPVTGIRLREMLHVVQPALSAGLAMTVALVVVKPYVAAATSGWPELLCDAAIGAAFYMGVLWLGWSRKLREMALLLYHLRRHA